MGPEIGPNREKSGSTWPTLFIKVTRLISLSSNESTPICQRHRWKSVSDLPKLLVNKLLSFCFLLLLLIVPKCIVFIRFYSPTQMFRNNCFVFLFYFLFSTIVASGEVHHIEDKDSYLCATLNCEDNQGVKKLALYSRKCSESYAVVCSEYLSVFLIIYFFHCYYKKLNVMIHGRVKPRKISWTCRLLV